MDFFQWAPRRDQRSSEGTSTPLLLSFVPLPTGAEPMIVDPPEALLPEVSSSPPSTPLTWGFRGLSFYFLSSKGYSSPFLHPMPSSHLGQEAKKSSLSRPSASIALASSSSPPVLSTRELQIIKQAELQP